MSRPATQVHISLSKVTEFLLKHGYPIVELYTCDGSVRFIETKTPKHQIPIMIYIPIKYKTVVPPQARGGKTHVGVPLKSVPFSKDRKNSRQVSYLTNIKGSFVDCDLLSLSTSFIYLLQNNGHSESFKLMNNDEHADVLEEIETPVQKIIKDASDVFNMIDEPFYTPTGDDTGSIPRRGRDSLRARPPDMSGGADEPDSPPWDDRSTSEWDDQDEPEEIVELEFEDADGESVAPVNDFITDEYPGPILGRPLGRAESGTKTTNGSEILNQSERSSVLGISVDRSERDPVAPTSFGRSERLPVEGVRGSETGLVQSEEDNDRGDDDIVLGMIYYTIELGSVYKIIEHVETEAATVMEIIDDNANNIRDDRVTRILEILEKLVIKVKAAYEDFSTEEDKLKSQAAQLSMLFDQTTSLKRKVLDEKYADNKSNIDRVHDQTRATIKEINLEMLRARDAIDEFLDITQSTLSELIDQSI